MLGPLVGPAAFGYSVDFWNGDLIASCVAAACLIAAGYFFAAKPLAFDYVERASAGLSSAVRKCGALSVSGLWLCQTPDSRRRAPFSERSPTSYAPRMVTAVSVRMSGRRGCAVLTVRSGLFQR